MAAETDRPVIVAFTLDFETGGLDPTKCACTQIAIHAVRIDTFEVIDRYVAYISPYRKQSDKSGNKRKVLKKKFEDEEDFMEYQEKALTYSAITMDMLNDHGVDIKQVAADVIAFIKKNTLSKGKNFKPFLIGQNVLFDVGFFQQLMEYGGQVKEWEKVIRGVRSFYGNWQPYYVDTIILGQLALSHIDGMNSYKLEIMCEKLGIELDDAHDADADVSATTNVAFVCAQRMRQAYSGGDDGGMVMAKKEKSRTHFKI